MIKKSVFEVLIMDIIKQKRNKKLEKEVKTAILHDSLLKLERINIAVDNGIVTLDGTVDSYAKKQSAEHVAKTIKGVKSIIQKIEVSFSFKNKAAVYMGINWALNVKLPYKNDDGFIAFPFDMIHTTDGFAKYRHKPLVTTTVAPQLNHPITNHFISHKLF